MRHLRALGRFAYDFVIGDDWRIAAGVAVLVGAAAVAVASGAVSTSAVAVAVALLAPALTGAGTVLTGLRAGRRPQR
jgi:hypothetical protein